MTGVSGVRARPRVDTAPDVEPYERGDEQERNETDSVQEDRKHTPKEATATSDGESARVRSELARDLVRRVDQLVPLVGDVSLATNIQFLKRDLSRCHDVLKDHPGESGFLSIVTLVESATAQLRWKHYTRQELEAIRQAFDIGYRQVHIGFEDYDKVRHLFATRKVETTPRIDLESLNPKDFTDGEED